MVDVFELLTTGASKGTPGDAKCVTKILVGGGTKNEVRGDKV